MAETTKRSNTTTTTIRLTSEEAETVRSAAAARGIGPSTFARAATLRAAGRAAPPARRNRTDMAIALAGVLGSLGPIGSSLDQLARHAKEGRVVAAAEFRDLRLAIEQLTVAVLALGEP